MKLHRKVLLIEVFSFINSYIIYVSNKLDFLKFCIRNICCVKFMIYFLVITAVRTSDMTMNLDLCISTRARI